MGEVASGAILPVPIYNTSASNKPETGSRLWAGLKYGFTELIGISSAEAASLTANPIVINVTAGVAEIQDFDSDKGFLSRYNSHLGAANRVISDRNSSSYLSYMDRLYNKSLEDHHKYGLTHPSSGLSTSFTQNVLTGINDAGHIAGAAFDMAFELLPDSVQKHLIAGISTVGDYAGEGLRSTFGNSNIDSAVKSWGSIPGGIRTGIGIFGPKVAVGATERIVHGTFGTVLNKGGTSRAIVGETNATLDRNIANTSLPTQSTVIPKLSNELATTFDRGKYTARVLEKDMILYRAGSKNAPLGQYFSKDKPISEVQVRINKALPHVWADGTVSNIDTVFKVKVLVHDKKVKDGINNGD